VAQYRADGHGLALAAWIASIIEAIPASDYPARIRSESGKKLVRKGEYLVRADGSEVEAKAGPFGQVIVQDRAVCVVCVADRLDDPNPLNLVDLSGLIRRGIFDSARSIADFSLDFLPPEYVDDAASGVVVTGSFSITVQGRI